MPSSFSEALLSLTLRSVGARDSLATRDASLLDRELGQKPPSQLCRFGGATRFIMSVRPAPSGARIMAERMPCCLCVVASEERREAPPATSS